ncbi:MAG: DMT family transporter [Pseudomonadota bacterium]|nr:DMT family transporter [Pseudomonadota bacterium]
MDATAKTYYWAVGLTLLAATCYALNSTFAAMSYSHGTDPLSVLTARSIVGTLGLFLLLKLKKAPLRLARGEFIAACGLAVLFTLAAFLILSSFQFIPVALAILIFYLFPLLTALGAWVFFREPLHPIFIVMLIAALAGLALALGTGASDLDPKGAGLALGSAFVVALLMLFNGRLVWGKDSRPYTLVIFAATALIFIAADVAVGRLALPVDAAGWGAFAGVAIAHSVAFIVMVMAVSMIGAVRVSLFLNFEPVATIAIGALILGQILTPLQLLGATIVVTAVVIAGRQKLATARG